MRPYNNYRYSGNEGQNISQACSAYINPTFGAEGQARAETTNFLQSLVQTIDTVETVTESEAYDAFSSNPAAAPSSEPVSARISLESEKLPQSAPRYWSFDEPTPPRSGSRPQKRSESPAIDSRNKDAEAFREPPVLAQVPDLSALSVRRSATSSSETPQNRSFPVDERSEFVPHSTAHSTPHPENLSATQETPVDASSSLTEESAPTMETPQPFAGIEKMEAEPMRAAHSNSLRKLQTLSNRLFHDDSFKLMSISFLMVVLVLGGVSYKMNRNHNTSDASSALTETSATPAATETALVNENNLSSSAPAVQSLSKANKESVAATDTQTPIETSVAVNQVSAESTPSDNSFAQQSFTEQMRQESMEDYSSPEIFAEETSFQPLVDNTAANNVSSNNGAAQGFSETVERFPAATATAAIAPYPAAGSEEEDVRQLPPPPAGSMAAQMAPVAPAIAGSAEVSKPFAQQDQNPYAAYSNQANATAAVPVGMDVKAPLNAYGTANASDMYTNQAPVSQAGTHTPPEEDLYASPTLGDDQMDSAQSAPFTARNPYSQIR